MTQCNSCMGNVTAGKSCYKCGLKGPIGQGAVWIGTLKVKRRNLRLIFRGVERNEVWERMLGHLQRCDAERCVVSLVREDFFISTEDDLDVRNIGKKEIPGYGNF